MTSHSTITDSDFNETSCVACDGGDDQVLYKARLADSSFSGRMFSARRLGSRQHYRIVRCRKCGLVRSSPILDPSRIDELYFDSGFLYSDEAPYAARTYLELFQRVCGRHLGRETVDGLVEIGCGNGFFVEQAVAAGSRNVVGFEPSRECCRAAPKSVQGMLVNDIFKPELVDLDRVEMAASFQVLDHLVRPDEYFRACAELLEPGGLVLTVCHNVEHISARLLGRHSPIVDVQHAFLFSPRTIGRLMERHGFEVVETGGLANRYPLEYWLGMMPSLRAASRLLPAGLLKTAITLPAGNLYAVGRRK